MVFMGVDFIIWNREFKNKMIYSIIICAKKESVRLPGKNLLPLCGKPLIQHTFDFIAKTFDLRLKNVWCVSDSPEILKLAHDSGIGQIKEPQRFTNNAHNMPLMRWIHEQLQSDKYIMFPPTSPVRDAGYMKNIVEHFLTFNYTSGFTAVNTGRLTFKANGSCFMWKSEQLEDSDIVSLRPRIYPDIYDFDIDTEEEFKRVESWMNEKRLIDKSEKRWINENKIDS